MKITQSVLNRVARATEGKSTIPNVFVEKSSVSADGSYAKVLFRIAASSAKAKEMVQARGPLVEAFDAKLDGSAHLVVSSVHATDVPDMYCGYIGLNSESMSFDMAQTRNFTSITANMFSDPEDNIWNLRESADGKILVRTSEDNLQELLSTQVASPSVSLAASSYDLNGSVVAGQLVAYYCNAAEEIRKGLSIDNSAVYDFKFKTVVETASCDLVAATNFRDSKAVVRDLDKLYGDKNITYKELAANSGAKTALVRYLTALYSQNRAFLDDYLAKIDSLLMV